MLEHLRGCSGAPPLPRLLQGSTPTRRSAGRRADLTSTLPPRRPISWRSRPPRFAACATIRALAVRAAGAAAARADAARRPPSPAGGRRRRAGFAGDLSPPRPSRDAIGRSSRREDPEHTPARAGAATRPRRGRRRPARRAADAGRPASAAAEASEEEANAGRAVGVIRPKIGPWAVGGGSRHGTGGAATVLPPCPPRARRQPRRRRRRLCPAPAVGNGAISSIRRARARGRRGAPPARRRGGGGGGAAMEPRCVRWPPEGAPCVSGSPISPRRRTPARRGRGWRAAWVGPSADACRECAARRQPVRRSCLRVRRRARVAVPCGRDARSRTLPQRPRRQRRCRGLRRRSPTCRPGRRATGGGAAAGFRARARTRRRAARVGRGGGRPLLSRGARHRLVAAASFFIGEGAARRRWHAQSRAAGDERAAVWAVGDALPPRHLPARVGERRARTRAHRRWCAPLRGATASSSPCAWARPRPSRSRSGPHRRPRHVAASPSAARSQPGPRRRARRRCSRRQRRSRRPVLTRRQQHRDCAAARRPPRRPRPALRDVNCSFARTPAGRPPPRTSPRARGPPARPTATQWQRLRHRLATAGGELRRPLAGGILLLGSSDCGVDGVGGSLARHPSVVVPRVAAHFDRRRRGCATMVEPAPSRGAAAAMGASVAAAAAAAAPEASPRSGTPSTLRRSRRRAAARGLQLRAANVSLADLLPRVQPDLRVRSSCDPARRPAVARRPALRAMRRAFERRGATSGGRVWPGGRAAGPSPRLRLLVVVLSAGLRADRAAGGRWCGTPHPHLGAFLYECKSRSWLCRKGCGRPHRHNRRRLGARIK